MKKPSILIAAVLAVGLLLTECGREGPIPPPDKIPPQVKSTIPVNGSMDVPVNLSGGITILFTKEMDASTIDDQTITLANGQNTVPGSITYTDTAGVSTAVFTPSSILNPTTLYQITVDMNVKDSYGIHMTAPYICSFKTGTAPDMTPPNVVDTTPANGNINVQPNAPIIMTLSEPVDPATISFLLSEGSATVPCTVSYSGTNAIFTPSISLAYSTQYTATVSRGVKDLAGNAMPNDYFWSFSTIAASDITPPVVTANTPATGTTGVSVNMALSMTFSEPVDPTTIVFTISTGGAIVPCTISYSGATAIFTPTISLAYNTLYTATVSAGVRDLAGNAMPNDYFWSFSTIAASDITPPVVTANTPATGTTGVSVNMALSMTFSEPVDPTTTVFTISTGGATVPCTMSYSGTTAIFTPSISLAYSTLYTATVSAGVRDLAGNAMPNDYFWSFSTIAASDITPPFATANTPAAGAVGVAVNIAPCVTFSEPVDPTTISFVLSSGSTTVPCAMSYSGTTAIFTPSISLTYSTQYTATVNAGVRDLAGNAMLNDYFWNFTTGTAVDTTPPNVTATTPSTGATGVAVTIAPSVTFSEPVDPATISFVLSTGSATVPCTMSYSGTTAIFTPSISLAYGTLYTATVSAGVKDLAGNAMPNGYFWSFMTGTALDMIPPSVTVTTPATGATAVAANIAPSVTFSEPVDPATITFTLTGGGATVLCTMTYSGTTAVFKPSIALKKNTLYTARVSAGVKDLAGNAMPNDYFWSFTTSKN